MSLEDQFNNASGRMDLMNTLKQMSELTLKAMYSAYAKRRREMIPWQYPWPVIQDPAEGEWTHERVNAGSHLLNKLSEVRKLVEFAAVGYLNGKGYVFQPSPQNPPPNNAANMRARDFEEQIQEPPCTCKYLPLALYFPDDPKALDCLAKLKISCHDFTNGHLRHCMETYEETFDCAVYLCELVGNPVKAQEVKDVLNHIPARTRRLAREVAGVQQEQ